LQHRELNADGMLLLAGNMIAGDGPEAKALSDTAGFFDWSRRRALTLRCAQQQSRSSTIQRCSQIATECRAAAQNALQQAFRPYPGYAGINQNPRDQLGKSGVDQY
jgi:hypothetical protein